MNGTANTTSGVTVNPVLAASIGGPTSSVAGQSVSVTSHSGSASLRKR